MVDAALGDRLSRGSRLLRRGRGLMIFVQRTLQVVLHVAGCFLEFLDAAPESASKLGDFLRTEQNEDDNQYTDDFRPA